MNWWCCMLIATIVKASAQFQTQLLQRQQLAAVDRNHRYNDELIILPLIPHHEQLRRRHRHQRDLHLPNANVNDNLQRTGSNRQYIPPSSRRRRTAFTSSSSAATTQVVEALYQGYGSHYVDLWCGTPTPQRQTVIVDTGSGVTAFPCLGCMNCGDDGHHVDQLYNQSSSKSFQKLTCNKCQKGHCHTGHKECQLGMTYQEGSSWSAYEVVDTCYAGGPHDSALSASSDPALDDVDPRLARSFAFPMTFGCQTHLTGLFETQLADGIMGMDNAETSFWYQMYQARKIRHKMFSLCYSRQPTAERQGTTAGAMTLGGSDPRLHMSPMVYSTLTPGDTGGWYSVHVRRVYLQKSNATSTDDVEIVALNVTEEDWNRGNTIVDSGTTSTYLSSLSLAYWNQVWEEVTGLPYFDTSTPVHLTREEFNQLPTILFQLQGDYTINSKILQNATTESEAKMTGLAGSLDPEFPSDVILAIPPAHYMEYDETNDEYLASIVFMDRKQHEGNVLGANAIMGHDVLFDVENGLVGWAESYCDYHQLLQSAQVDTAATTSSPRQGNPISHVAIDSCDSLACQGPIVACLVCILAAGLCIGRCMGRARSKLDGYQPATLSELELSHNLSKTTTDGNFVQYRDDPISPASDNDAPTTNTSRNGASQVPQLS